jgi:hypothetical protein
LALQQTLTFQTTKLGAVVPFQEKYSERQEQKPGAKPTLGDNMKKWKYAVISISTSGQAPEQLNAVGAEGWELVSVVHTPGTTQILAFLKKPSE